MRSIFRLVYTLSIVLSVASANASSCRDFFETTTAPDSGDSHFSRNDLDWEIPILKKRAHFIRRSGLIELALTQNQSQVPLRILQPMFAKAEIELKKISILKETNSFGHKFKLLFVAADLKKKLRRYQEQPLEHTIARAELSSFIYEITEVLSEWQALAQNGKYTFEKYNDIKNTDQFKALNLSVPMLGTPHPETILFLASKGVFLWEFSPISKYIDGSIETLSPFKIAMHDANHIVSLQRSINGSPYGSRFSNRKKGLKVAGDFFNIVWNEFINRPDQTLRERELAIFILHMAFFEQADPPAMTLEGLNEYLQNDSSTLGVLGFGSLLFRLQRNNDLSSDVLKERPVNAHELQKVFTEMRQWLSMKTSTNL